MKTMIVLFAVAALANGQWQQQWGAPQAAPVPQDTPEVAAAKAAHFAAVARVATTAPQVHQGQHVQPTHYQGPVALPPGFDANGAPLPVQDTPEVAAAKAAQLNTLASAGGHVPTTTWNAAPAPVPTWNAAPAPATTWNAAPATTWNAAPAPAPAPGWTNDPLWNVPSAQVAGPAGLPADTPEVAAAKAAHLAAHQAASASASTHGRWRRSVALTSYPGSTAPLLPAAPLIHAAPVVRTAPLVHALPLTRAWGYPTLGHGYYW